jgi:hypothetical protein
MALPAASVTALVRVNGRSSADTMSAAHGQGRVPGIAAYRQRLHGSH